MDVYIMLEVLDTFYNNISYLSAFHFGDKLHIVSVDISFSSLWYTTWEMITMIFDLNASFHSKMVIKQQHSTSLMIAKIQMNVRGPHLLTFTESVTDIY